MKKSLRKLSNFLLVGIFVFFGLSIGSFSFADLGGYTIDNYQTTIELNEEGELLVKEEIDVNFSESRHGIYREIPYRYEGNNGKTVKTKIYDIQVDGYQFKTSTEGENFKIRIGSPDKYVNGRQYYTIHYKIYGGIRSFGKGSDAYQELYWNMLGTQWNLPINHFKFSFILPTDLDLQNNEYYAISGKYGEKNPVTVAKQGKTITMQTALNLQAHEGVTLAVKLPSDYVQLDWKKDFPWWYLLFLVPLGVGIYLFNIWKKYGDDEEVRDIIYYTPPKGYTPGQIASIYKKKATNKTIFATIYSWATKGYIKIKHDKLGSGIFSVSTFNIEKLNEKKHILEFEKKLWNVFFNNGNIFSFNDGNTIYNAIQKIGKKSYNSIEKKLFTSKSLGWKEQINNYNGFFTLGFVLLALLISFGVINIDINNILIYFIISALIIYVEIMIFLRYIDKLSPEGKELYEQVVGYKKYLKTVEEPKLQQLIKDDPQYFEKVLPYAVALGMETEWIEKCEKALTKSNYHPVWIYGSGFDSSSVSSITSSISNSMEGFGSASAFSAPSSSGSSSGSGGGGFSGGGGGGGGGGSW